MICCYQFVVKSLLSFFAENLKNSKQTGEVAVGGRVAKKGQMISRSPLETSTVV